MNSMRVTLLGLVTLGASVADGQVMRLTGYSDEIEADYYYYNVEHTDWQESGGYLQHHVMPRAGWISFETRIDFSNPQAPSLFRFSGDVDGAGSFEVEMWGAVTAQQLPSGKWSLGILSYPESPNLDFLYAPTFVLDPSKRFQDPIYLEIRTYRDAGISYGDTVFRAVFDQVEFPDVTPDITPIPEPATTALFGVATLAGAAGFSLRRKTKVRRHALS